MLRTTMGKEVSQASTMPVSAKNLAREPDSMCYKGSFNQLVNAARVYTQDDKSVVTPRWDTP